MLIAPSPRNRAFRSQLGQLRKMFERYAAQKTVFIAAFTQEGGVIRSNIPFMVLRTVRAWATNTKAARGSASPLSAEMAILTT